MALPFRSGPEPAARRRRQFLSREEIIEAAAAILERDGYDALNMRAIAAELGVRAAALYRYVQSREELDDILFDHLMAGCTPALQGKDWREDLRAIAQAWRERLVSRRDATRIALGQISIGPNLLPLMEATLGVLRGAGLGDEALVEAYRTLTLFVHSFASSEAAYRSLQARDGGVRFSPAQPEWVAPYPLVSAVAERLSRPADFDKHFAFALDALIAGIERRLTTSA
ncbi:MAG: TetR/AcrR family transcriptional regulator [Caulobacterales bacterium]